jgi:hypothetical protein
MGKKAHPLAARIKRMMQTDEEVGKIAQATPVMIGMCFVHKVLVVSHPLLTACPYAARAMELFLEKLCKGSAEVALGRKAKTLTPSHL